MFLACSVEYTCGGIDSVTASKCSIRIQKAYSRESLAKTFSYFLILRLYIPLQSFQIQPVSFAKKMTSFPIESIALQPQSLNETLMHDRILAIPSRFGEAAEPTNVNATPGGEESYEPQVGFGHVKRRSRLRMFAVLSAIYVRRFSFGPSALSCFTDGVTEGFLPALLFHWGSRSSHCSNSNTYHYLRPPLCRWLYLDWWNLPLG